MNKSKLISIMQSIFNFVQHVDSISIQYHLPVIVLIISTFIAQYFIYFFLSSFVGESIQSKVVYMSAHLTTGVYWAELLN